jgi:hypothetical protein
MSKNVSGVPLRMYFRDRELITALINNLLHNDEKWLSRKLPNFFIDKIN